jgi:hypothetical protein
MAKGRMLNKKISRDEKVNSLSSVKSQLIFTWIIPHLDKNGCFHGDSSAIKALVFPSNRFISARQINKSLQEFAAKLLIVRYNVQGISYIHYPNFDKNQPNLRKDREAESDIPPYPKLTDFTPSITPSITPDISKAEAEAEAEVEAEGERALYAQLPLAVASFLEGYHVTLEDTAIKDLVSWCGKLPVENILKGLKDSIDHDAHSWAYARTIFQRIESERGKK